MLTTGEHKCNGIEYLYLIAWSYKIIHNTITCSMEEYTVTNRVKKAIKALKACEYKELSASGGYSAMRILRKLGELDSESWDRDDVLYILRQFGLVNHGTVTSAISRATRKGEIIITGVNIPPEVTSGEITTKIKTANGYVAQVPAQGAWVDWTVKKRKVQFTVKKKVKKWLCIADLHNPFVHWPLLKLLGKFAKEFHGLVINGDFNDSYAVSRHNFSERVILERMAAGMLLDEYASGNMILDLIDSWGIPEKHFVLGNHDDWLRKISESHLRLRKMLDFKKNFKLKERGYVCTDYATHNNSINIGHLKVTHGTRAGIHATRQMVLDHMGHIMHGHTHTAGLVLVGSAGRGDPKMGISIPMLGNIYDRNLEYLRGRVTPLINGFVVLNVTDDGLFFPEIHLLIDNKICYGGKVYEVAPCKQYLYSCER